MEHLPSKTWANLKFVKDGPFELLGLKWFVSLCIYFFVEASREKY
jgi:hypothetical protein